MAARFRLHFLVLFLAIWPNCEMFSQVEVRGTILKDTLRPGEPFSYSLTCRHPKGQSVFFPNKTFQSDQFTVLGIRYFPSTTTENLMTDSAVYQLVTFKTEPFLSLGLPVWVSQNQDSTALFAPRDSAFIQLSFDRKDIPELTLNKDTALAPVHSVATLSYVLSALSFLFVLGIIIFTFFGVAIRKWFRTRWLQYRHRQFLLSFDRLVTATNQKTTDLQYAVNVWKNYLSEIENVAYGAMTSSEISQRLDHSPLNDALNNIDRLLYSQAEAVDSSAPLEVLRQVAEERYEKRRNEILTPTR